MTGLLPSAEQRAIVDAVSGPIAAILPLARLHAPAGADVGLLPQLGALGCLGIGLDEGCGGAGLTAVEEALLFEKLGRQLASPCVLACVLGAHLAAAGGEREDATALAAGERPVGLATRSTVVGCVLLIDTRDERTLVLMGSDGPAWLEADQLLQRRRLASSAWGLTMDQARLDAAVAPAPSSLALRARLLIAAQLAGIAGGARDMAVEYAKIRQQFGKPIGSFQAVKHHCADMAAEAMAAADLLAFAAVAVAEGRADAAFQVHAALCVAARAAKANAAANVQVHGGMGFSDECHAHLFVKHAHVWETIAGGREAVHAALLAERSPIRPATRMH